MSAFPEVHTPFHPPSSTHAASPLGEKRTPVVMLHGGTAARWMWAEQVDALRDRLVLTLDLPGFGRRAAETWPGLDAAADDVITRVRQLGVDEPFHLVGLSLGAVTALRVLARSSSRTVSLFAARTWRPLQPRCTRAACRPDSVPTPGGSWPSPPSMTRCRSGNHSRSSALRRPRRSFAWRPGCTTSGTSRTSTSSTMCCSPGCASRSTRGFCAPMLPRDTVPSSLPVPVGRVSRGSPPRGRPGHRCRA